MGTTCPLAVHCPACGATEGHRCKRPSGHVAMELHVDRIRVAEEFDHRAGIKLPGAYTPLGSHHIPGQLEIE